jgi:uncharacterized membrane protein YtjA (UPF0391 family)
MEARMLGLSLIFLVLAINSAIFGFANIPVPATNIAKVLFFVFIVAFLVTLILGLVRRRTQKV